MSKSQIQQIVDFELRIQELTEENQHLVEMVQDNEQSKQEHLVYVSDIKEKLNMLIEENQSLTKMLDEKDQAIENTKLRFKQMQDTEKQKQRELQQTQEKSIVELFQREMKDIEDKFETERNQYIFEIAESKQQIEQLERKLNDYQSQQNMLVNRQNEIEESYKEDIQTLNKIVFGDHQKDAAPEKYASN